MGPKAIHSTVLTIEEEAMIVEFRRHTLLLLEHSHIERNRWGIHKREIV